MIRPARSSASSVLSAPLFYLFPEKKNQYCNIIVFFLLFILFFVYFCRIVTLEKNSNKTIKQLSAFLCHVAKNAQYDIRLNFFVNVVS